MTDASSTIQTNPEDGMILGGTGRSQASSSTPIPPSPICVGRAQVSVPYVPAPHRSGCWIQYFDLHEQSMVPIVFEAARLIHEAADPRHELYTVESSTFEIAFLLRTQYARQVVNIHKRLHPSFTGRNTEHVVYHPFTADSPRQLFFPKRPDPSVRKMVTLFDSVTTTGQTLKAAAEALQRQNIFVEKAIVLFTEAEEGQPHLAEVSVSDSYSFPIQAFGQLTRYRMRSDSVTTSPQSRPLMRRSPTNTGTPTTAMRMDGEALERPPSCEPLPAPSSVPSNDSSCGLGGDDDEASAPLVHFSLYSSAKIPTQYGSVQFAVFTGTTGRNAICVVGKGGELDTTQPVLVRIHDACITSECFKSCKCDCREQLEAALDIISREGGMVIYLLQEGRGIGLAAKIAAYALQESQHLDTVDANRALGLPDDARTYEAARDILRHFRVSQVVLMTNNPLKREKMEELGVAVMGMQSLVVPPNSEACRRYLETKAERMRHALPISTHRSKLDATASDPSTTVGDGDNAC